MIEFSDILDSIEPQMRDFDQETRIRELYDRTCSAYQTDRAHGIKKVLSSDWSNLKTRFDTAIQKVKKETGLF